MLRRNPRSSAACISIMPIPSMSRQKAVKHLLSLSSFASLSAEVSNYQHTPKQWRIETRGCPWPTAIKFLASMPPISSAPCILFYFLKLFSESHVHLHVDIHWMLGATAPSLPPFLHETVSKMTHFTTQKKKKRAYIDARPSRHPFESKTFVDYLIIHT